MTTCRALLRIPTLAIHFTRQYDKFEFDLERHLRPFFATECIDTAADKKVAADCELSLREYPAMLTLIAEELQVKPEDIVELDLNLIDTQPACFMGIHKEFISSARMDNQISCHCGMEAFKDLHTDDEFLKNDKDINIFVMFDNEEIGSKTQQGALSTYLSDVAKRIFHRAAIGPDTEELYNAALRRSFLVSADLAHATNPNYADMHQDIHHVDMHKGVVVKTNANISYATDSVSSVMFKELAKRADVPVQEFIVKCGALCGTTVGPLLNTNTCIKTVDIGIGQLSMHSIRETCGTTDVYYYYKFMLAFYREYGNIDKTFLGC